MDVAGITELLTPSTVTHCLHTRPHHLRLSLLSASLTTSPCLTSSDLCDLSDLPLPTDGPPVGAGSCATLPLPWGARRERHSFPASVQIDPDLRPGEFVMRTLFAEFTVQAERKIETVMMEPLVGAGGGGGAGDEEGG